MVIIRVNLRKAKTFLLECFVCSVKKAIRIMRNYFRIGSMEGMEGNGRDGAGMEMSEVRVIFVIKITKELF